MSLKSKIALSLLGVGLLGGAFVAGRESKSEPTVTINYAIPIDPNERQVYTSQRTRIILKASEVSEYLHKHRHFMQDVSLSPPEYR